MLPRTGALTIKPEAFTKWCLLLVTFSVLIERLTFIGQPNLGKFRFVLSVVIMLVFLVWAIPRFLDIRFSTAILMLFASTLALMVYEFVMLIRRNDNERIYFLIFCSYWIIGYYMFGHNPKKYMRYLVNLGIISGIIGWIFWILGPDNLRNIGIGAIDRFWGQEVRVDGTNIYRSYSIFSDHQTFCAFMQFVGVMIRVDHVRIPRRNNLWTILLLFFLSIPTFSTTGFVVFLMLILSFLPKTILLIGGGLAAMFAASISLSNNVFFHMDSLQWRILFILRQISLITWYPHPHVTFVVAEGGGMGFTNDCFFTSGCYSHGAIWGVIYLVYICTLLLALGKKGLPAMGYIAAFVLINSITNGVPFTSTPIMVFFPLYVGMMMRGIKARIN